MMCCKVLFINEPELKKPPGVWCRHAVAGKGCGIYASRPTGCQTFYCQWMLDPRFGPEWKPEKSKFVVYVQHDEAIRYIAVDPSFPDAWTKPPYFAQIKKWAVDGAERKQFVLVRIGARLIAVLPDRIVDMGKVDPDAQLVVSRQRTLAGLTYDIEVKPRESAAVLDDRKP